MLVGLYLPPPAISLLYELMQHVISYDMQNVILMGDFNLAPCPTLDRLRPLSRRSPDLLQWAMTFELVDAWRHCHPTDREYICHVSDPLPHRLGVFSQVVAAADIESANTPQGYLGSFSPHDDGAARTPSWPEVVKAAWSLAGGP